MKDKGTTIVAVRHWLVRVPFHAPIVWGSGVRSGPTRLICEITTADGAKGYGETICLLDAIEPVFRNIVAKVAIGKRIDQAEVIHRNVLGAGYYHHKRAAVMAMCALEMAMWDAKGRISGLSLSQMWGGHYRTSVDFSAYLFVADPAALKEEAQRFLDRGYRSFKVKIGVDEKSDISLVHAMRETVGEAGLRADVNGAWTIGTAKRQLAKLAEYDLSYIEQPLELDDLAGHAHLRSMQPVPVALDESAYTLSDVGNIIREGAADVVLLDPHEAGGLWPCIKAAAVCESVGIPVTLHSGGELGFSQAAYVHLAASIPNMTISIDTELDYLSDDVTTTPFRMAGGALAVPAGPGLGVEPDFDKLEKYRVTDIRGAYLDPARPDWFPVKPAY